jgi:ABC-type branched-subunit amino acid transport system permease subunit
MKLTRAALWVNAVLIVLALAAPVLGIYPVFAMKLLCYALFACAFNLLLGYTRMLSFGHAAFFGAAGYVTGWLVESRGWGTLGGIAGGVVAALLLGALIGAIAVRRRGIYFAMITMALAQLVPAARMDCRQFRAVACSASLTWSAMARCTTLCLPFL